MCGTFGAGVNDPFFTMSPTVTFDALLLEPVCLSDFFIVMSYHSHTCGNVSTNYFQLIFGGSTGSRIL